jgi:hypothetical protein
MTFSFTKNVNSIPEKWSLEFRIAGNCLMHAKHPEIQELKKSKLDEMTNLFSSLVHLTALLAE